MVARLPFEWCAHFAFDITSDQNIRYQQNLAGRSIPILEIFTNDLRRILATAVEIQDAVVSSKAGEVRHLVIP